MIMWLIVVLTILIAIVLIVAGYKRNEAARLEKENTWRRNIKEEKIRTKEEKNREPALQVTNATPDIATQTKLTALLSDEIAMGRIVQRTARPVIYYPKTFPQPHPMHSLSFFGGSPIAPPDFQWPIDPKTNRPIVFMGQIDLDQMPRNDATRLLPQSGVLYFFQNHTSKSQPDAVHYQPKPSSDWLEIAPPTDLPMPSTQSNGLTGHIENQKRAFPKWEITPTAATSYAQTSNFYVMDNGELAEAVSDDWDGDTNDFWGDETDDAWDAAFNRLNIAETARVLGEHQHTRFASKPDFSLGGAEFNQAMPPVWMGPLEVLSGITLARETPEDEASKFSDLLKQVLALSRKKNPMDAFHAPDRALFLQLLELKCTYVRDQLWNKAVKRSILGCLSYSEQTASLITPEQLSHVRQAFNQLPQQTGGYPSSVQGHYVENIWGHVLLFQTYDDRTLNWGFDALMQFWIAFDDLKNERWDKAFMTMDVS